MESTPIGGEGNGGEGREKEGREWDKTEKGSDTGMAFWSCLKLGEGLGLHSPTATSHRTQAALGMGEHLGKGLSLPNGNSWRRLTPEGPGQQQGQQLGEQVLCFWREYIAKYYKILYALFTELAKRTLILENSQTSPRPSGG